MVSSNRHFIGAPRVPETIWLVWLPSLVGSPEPSYHVFDDRTNAQEYMEDWNHYGVESTLEEINPL